MEIVFALGLVYVACLILVGKLVAEGIKWVVEIVGRKNR